MAELQRANTPPVDLDQSAIGPGMAVFSKYRQVMEGDGVMSVRSALALINQTMEEILTGTDADYDSRTRWAISWFSPYGMKEGPFGDAETLCKAKDVSVASLVDSGILYAKGGKVRILGRDEVGESADSKDADHATVWGTTQRMMRTLEKRGESGAAEMLALVAGGAESVKELCYRLFNICERQGWAQEAVGYNTLISSWPEIARLVASAPAGPEPGELDFG